MTPKTDYMLYCSGCHLPSGAGNSKAGVPDLRGYVGSFGRTEAGRVYLMHVPGIIESDLDNAELAAVMNYVFKRWGAAPDEDPVPPFTTEEVRRLRAVSVPDVVKKRREVVKELEARDLPVAAYPWD